MASAPGSPSAAAILASVGLEADLVDRPVDQLSGGQLRRVALAGLIARHPRLLILDEPLAGLDASGQLELLQLLGRARAELGLTLIVISHDNVDMHLACSRVLELTHGQLRPLDAMTDAR